MGHFCELFGGNFCGPFGGPLQDIWRPFIGILVGPLGGMSGGLLSGPFGGPIGGPLGGPFSGPVKIDCLFKNNGLELWVKKKEKESITLMDVIV